MGGPETRSLSLSAGKIPGALLTELLAVLLPPSPELRLGPAVGEDACANEGAAVLAAEAADRLKTIEPAVLQAALSATERPGVSVVEAALSAARLRATALHDVTEGGLAAGLHELAYASGIRLRVEREAVIWFEPGLAVCRALGADHGRRSARERCWRRSRRRAWTRRCVL